MGTRPRFSLFWIAAACLVLARSALAQVPSPESFFGFRLGTDGRLASAEQIERYFEAVAAQSNRARIVDLGPTTEGHRTIAAIVSAPENIQNLERIRDANQRLADPRTLLPDDAHQLERTQKAVVAIGGSIHASEIGATQALTELLYTLATSAEPATLDELRNLVIIVIPSLNPDGHRLVVDWYNSHSGTMYDGGPMPSLYHKYAGHDLNRDAFMMNMAESRNLGKFFYTSWHPQVFLTMHQMGTGGPRFAAPPTTDPIDPNYDPIIWREAGLLGSAMTLQLARDGRHGVVSNALYDYFWPGYEDSAPLGHNTVCLLTEAASVQIASPVTVSPSDLRAGGRGLSLVRPQVNFPDPWPGGRWTLRDIVDYDLSAVTGLLNAASLYREQIVGNFYEMGAKAVAAGARGGPFAFIIPPEQRDRLATKKLEELLIAGGVEIQRALEPFRADGDPYPPGSDIVLLAQPYRAYVKTLLERQRYPGDADGRGSAAATSYDAVGWTLPAQMGVDVITIERTFEPPAMSRVTAPAIPPARAWADKNPSFYVLDAHGVAGAIAANRLLASGLAPQWLTADLDVRGVRYPTGSLVVVVSKAAKAAPMVLQRLATEFGLRSDGLSGKPPATVRPVARSRIALYKPWTENTDEGWTRWLLEQFEFPVKSITDADIRAGNLRTEFDVIVLPSESAARIRSGQPIELVPAQYAGGLGEPGTAAIKAFVEAGGTIVALDQSTEFAISALGLPVRDVTRDPASAQFSCPGSLVRLDVDRGNPLAYGIDAGAAGFFASSSAFDADGASASVAVRYVNRDVLVSGWIEHEEVIAGRAAALRIPAGSGSVVLLGFPAQHRGQSYATFRLLFNALLTSAR